MTVLKTIGVFLATLLMLSTLSACGNESSANKSADPAANKTSEAADDANHSLEEQQP